MNYRSISYLLLAWSLPPALCADEAAESPKKEQKMAPRVAAPKDVGEEGQAAPEEPEAKGEALKIELHLKDFEGAPGEPKAKGEALKIELNLKDFEGAPGEPKAKGGGLKLELNLKDLRGRRGKEKKGGKESRLKILGSTTFKMQDQEGSVETKNIDGGKEIIVRDKEGKILFGGPWDTTQDKAAASPEIRERIEKLDLGNRIDLQLKTVPRPKKDEPEEEKIPEKKGGELE
jgi:hypothetical protein